MGARRICAKEGYPFSKEMNGKIFKQFVGSELIRLARFSSNRIKIKYWRDHDGPEVDWIVDTGTTLIPIEVKWSDMPKEKDARHLNTFIREYDNASRGYIISRTLMPYSLSENVDVLPWSGLNGIFSLQS